MTSNQPIDCNTAFVRFLPVLKEERPDSRGTILIHGIPSDTASYAEAAKAWDFKVEISASSAEFIQHLDQNEHILFILITGDEIEPCVLDGLARACASIEPLYAMHITTYDGEIPETNKRYRLFLHSKDLLPGDAAVEKVSLATDRLFHRANAQALSGDPVPEWLDQELARKKKL